MRAKARTLQQLMEMKGTHQPFEGDGLQAVHNCFEMNSALAAEGLPFRSNRQFFRSPFSRAANALRATALAAGVRFHRSSMQVQAEKTYLRAEEAA